MRQSSGTISVATRGKGLYEFTGKVEDCVAGQGIEMGLLTLFLLHTSASLTVQENADPDVIADLNDFLERLVPEMTPENDRRYRHTSEGSDDMPAHIRAALTMTQLSIPVRAGRPALGTWQGIYVFEHRARPHRRSVLLHLIGD